VKAIVLNKTGGLDVLKISEIPVPEPEKDEALIKMKYAAVNYADLLCRQGLYSWAEKRPYILGLEGLGYIERLGTDVTGFNVGDRVIVGKNHGCDAEFTTIKAKHLALAPDYLNDEESASFLGSFLTAWVAMHEMARVRRGEIMLVHAGAGALGTAAIQLGRAHDMKVYGTASNPSKFKIIEDLGGTPLSYDNFDTMLMENDRPHFVLEAIGGAVFKRSFEVMAPMGRMVCVGGTGIQVNKKNPLSIIRALRSIPKRKLSEVLRPSKGFMGVHLGYIRDHPEMFTRIWPDLLRVCTENELRPIIHNSQIFPMSNVAAAHQLIHDRKNVGKVLLDVSR